MSEVTLYTNTRRLQVGSCRRTLHFYLVHKKTTLSKKLGVFEGCLSLNLGKGGRAGVSPVLETHATLGYDTNRKSLKVHYPTKRSLGLSCGVRVVRLVLSTYW